MQTPSVFFHVTQASNLSAILAEGLVPRIGDRSLDMGETESAVYLFDSPESVEDATWLAECFDEDEEMVVLEIPCEFATSAVPSFDDEESSFEWKCFQGIPAHGITIDDEESSFEWKCFQGIPAHGITISSIQF